MRIHVSGIASEIYLVRRAASPHLRCGYTRTRRRIEYIGRLKIHSIGVPSIMLEKMYILVTFFPLGGVDFEGVPVKEAFARTSKNTKSIVVCVILSTHIVPLSLRTAVRFFIQRLCRAALSLVTRRACACLCVYDAAPP